MFAVVAVLDPSHAVRVVTPDTPILRGDDAGILRGDGIFESLHIREGAVWLLDQHLARLTRSAEMTELALPPTPRLIELVQAVLAAWPTHVQGRLRIICTRGAEDGTSAPTVFAIATPVDQEVLRAREHGVSVVSASLGLPADVRARAPWLLGGAKTISYAVNMASQRWAHSVGADDVLWISVEGYALEGPTSTLVWLSDSTLHTVPAQHTGILAGTTARWLLDHAEVLGWSSADAMVTTDELRACSGAWLLSSVRGVVAIRTLDGSTMPYPIDITRKIQELLGYGPGGGATLEV